MTAKPFKNVQETYQFTGVAGAVVWAVRALLGVGGPWAIATMVLFLTLFGGVVTAGYYWFKLVNANTEVNVQTAVFLQQLSNEVKGTRGVLDGGIAKQNEIDQNIREIKQNWNEFKKERGK